MISRKTFLIFILNSKCPHEQGHFLMPQKPSGSQFLRWKLILFQQLQQMTLLLS